MTFKQAHDCDFADSSRANSLGFLPALVHEPRGSADVGFVGLNVVLQSVERLVLQGQPDAMIHEPCGLLGDMEIAANLVGTDTVLAVDHHPQSGEPFRERERRVLEGGSDLHGELAPWVVRSTLPSAALSIEFDALGAASRTLDYTIRPALRCQLPNAVVGVVVKDDRFLQSGRLGHGFFPHIKCHNRVNWTSQVCFCLQKDTIRPVSDPRPARLCDFAASRPVARRAIR